jgi:BCD family chlorophyll transporter-like MFS transporter
MKRLNVALASGWARLSPGLLPFADAASPELPLPRLMRLALFQVSVGMAVALLNGTLNRVMIVELAVPAWLVSTMVALPLVFAPLRALIGFRSDVHRSAIGWRRVPYIWMGTLLQFGGLAIMPFALLVLSGGANGAPWVGQAGAALAFLLVGAGLHTTQTAGLALATDLSPQHAVPRVVALLYVMLLLGMVTSSLAFGVLLGEFGEIKLIQVVQGAAAVTFLLNVVALWKQEPRNPTRTSRRDPRPAFRDAWRAHLRNPRSRRFLLAVGLGTAGFSMQDILLEPYGGEVLRLSVAETAALTAVFTIGTLAGFALAARRLARGADAYRLAALGAVAGVFAFACVILSAPTQSAFLFRAGTMAIGFGAGLFAVGTLTAAMAQQADGQNGLALGAWGAVQATAAGVAIALGGALRDAAAALAQAGALGPALTEAATGYGVVYHVEIVLLFLALAVIGPLVGSSTAPLSPSSRFGLADVPG